MMYSNNNNNNFAFIAKASATDVDAIDAAGNRLAVTDLLDGDVVIVGADNQVRDHNTALAAGDTFKFASRTAGRLYYSPLFNFSLL